MCGSPRATSEEPPLHMSSDWPANASSLEACLLSGRAAVWRLFQRCINELNLSSVARSHLHLLHPDSTPTFLSQRCHKATFNHTPSPYKKALWFIPPTIFTSGCCTHARPVPARTFQQQITFHRFHRFRTLHRTNQILSFYSPSPRQSFNSQPEHEKEKNVEAVISRFYQRRCSVNKQSCDQRLSEW